MLNTGNLQHFIHICGLGYTRGMAAIIFDFDGTIADSFDYVADFLAASSRRAPLSTHQKQDLRQRSMIRMARQLGHPWWRLPSLFMKGRKQMTAGITDIKPFAGIPEVLQKLHAEGHELFIVSSNTVVSIHAFLHHHNLHTYFLEVDGNVGLLGKGRALRRLLKAQSLETNDAVYIGDERRDIHGAQVIDMRIIAVTWGFDQPAALKALKPTAVANKPAELITILEEL